MAKRIITIDDYAADNGKDKNHEEHTTYFNSQNEVMIDASDVYNGRFSDVGLISFRQDCKESVLRLAGIIFYNPNNSFGSIIHHYGSKVVKPDFARVSIPFFNKESIKDVISAPIGLRYMQAYCDTTDGGRRITSRFEFISDLTADKIFIWTPIQGSRKQNPMMVSGLRYYGIFHIHGDDIIVNATGRSRAVHYSDECNKGTKIREANNACEAAAME